MRERFKVCIIIICLIVLFLVSCDIHKEEQDTKTTTTPTEPTKTATNQNEDEIDDEEVLVIDSLGEFKLTAYCPCQRCCNEWALNRPIDKDGNEIVYGSTGETLIEGVSIAVDPSVIPYGSEVIIDGQTYIAHDTGGAIKKNRIDVYMSDHNRALDFGVKYAEVYMISR